MPLASQSGRSQVTYTKMGEKFTGFRCRLKLRNRLELLERAGERIRQTPHRARRELLVLRLKIQPVDRRTTDSLALPASLRRMPHGRSAWPVRGDLCLPPVFNLGAAGVRSSSGFCPLQRQDRLPNWDYQCLISVQSVVVLVRLDPIIPYETGSRCNGRDQSCFRLVLYSCGAMHSSGWRLLDPPQSFRCIRH